MGRLLGWFPWSRSVAYERVESGEGEGEGEAGGSEGRGTEYDIGRAILADSDDRRKQGVFSWLDYSIFLLLGIAQLWAWNMFLAAAPYFQIRFKDDDWVLAHFQSTILTVSTMTNLVSMVVLTYMQSGASYPKRIVASLLMNVACCILLALSTGTFTASSAATYLGFVLLMVFVTSLAAGYSQNGSLAYVSSFARDEYTQAIMAGQAVAGVLPCIAQIASVMAVPQSYEHKRTGEGSSQSAMVSFLIATAISAFTLLAFFVLFARDQSRRARGVVYKENSPNTKSTVSLWTLFKKLRWFSGAIFIDFSVTMVYPVFTQATMSVNDHGDAASRMYKPDVFIPLAFLMWNIGDLSGRLLPLVPKLAFREYPKAVFVFSVARVAFIPLYELCNVQGRGAAIPSDFFYLVVVQFLFGVTNGWIGSICMMGSRYWVEEHEAPAAGAFMGLMLNAGLSVGSLLSFLAAKG